MQATVLLNQAINVKFTSMSSTGAHIYKYTCSYIQNNKNNTIK